MALRAVLFDVDFTIAKPGPDLGPEGYRQLGERFGLDLDPERYAEARAHAVGTVERHPELDHDEEVWVLFTEQIIRGMGGNTDRAYECAVEMTRAWEHAHNFEIFEDVLPTLAELRAHGLKIGLVSNTGRNLDEFVAHHGLGVDAAVTAGLGGGVILQLIVFIAVSLASLAFLRPIARRHIRMPALTRTGTAALVGTKALVLQRVDVNGGRVRIGGEEWSARAFFEEQTLEPGTRVEVAKIEGATALVFE